MTLHVSYDHQCPECEAWYIPYDDHVPCPKCGLIEVRRFDFIPHAAASARANLVERKRYIPAAWIDNSFADHLLWLLFLILEAHRQEQNGRPFCEAARESVEKIKWGDQAYGKEHLYGIALRVYEELERTPSVNQIRWKPSLLRNLAKWIFG